MNKYFEDANLLKTEETAYGVRIFSGGLITELQRCCLR